MKGKVKSAQEILTSLPNKQYFTIGEAADACGVKPYVLRYWEQEFPQFKPLRRNKRRYYRRENIEFIILLRDLLHVRRFTTRGAREYLANMGHDKQENRQEKTTYTALTRSVRKLDQLINRLQDLTITR